MIPAEEFVSPYAAVSPAEFFAETFSIYLLDEIICLIELAPTKTHKKTNPKKVYFRNFTKYNTLLKLTFSIKFLL